MGGRNMKRMLMGVGLAAVAAAVVQGCMPETLEVGRTPIDAGGASGESGSGDDTGGSVAAKGGEAGAGSGAGTGTQGGSAGRSGVGGKGGAAGQGGSSRGGAGGGGGTSGAGTGGEGGDPRIRFDPACDCSAFIDDGFGEFTCSMPVALFAERVALPESCDNDEEHMLKQACADGTTRYEWIVGQENDYEMVFDGETLVHGSVFGYGIGELCDFSYTDPSIRGETGVVSAGSRPESECTDECAICESGELEVPFCPCARVPGKPYAVIERLEEYCVERDCPLTLAEARASLVSECDTSSRRMLMSTGCGLVRVDKTNGFSGSSYYYDQVSSTLVGVSVGDDLPWGECYANVYLGGYVPMEACNEATICDLCRSPDDGAAGGAGEDTGVEPCPP
jgi:hypothetical protein